MTPRNHAPTKYTPAAQAVIERIESAASNTHEWRIGNNVYRWRLTGTTDNGGAMGVIERQHDTDDWRRSGSFILSGDGTVLRGPPWFKSAAIGGISVLDRSPKEAINRVWNAIMLSAERVGAKPCQAWYEATTACERQERESRSSAIARLHVAPTLPVEIAGRYFATMAYLDTMAKVMTRNPNAKPGTRHAGIDVVDIVEQRRGEVLARAVAYYMWIKNAGVQIIDLDVKAVLAFDYVTAMTIKARTDR